MVIPAYNEEKTISRVIEKVKQNAPGFDIVVIDDGSTDSTASAARQTGARVLSHPVNLGAGAATQTAYKYCERHLYEFVVQLDADGQHDPRYIADLLRILENGSADLVIGSRFLGRQGYKPPWIRKIGMSIFGGLTSLIIGQRTTDTTSGFRALNRKVVDFFAKINYPADYQDADVLILAHFAGFRIREVPVTMYQNPQGRSQLDSWRLIYYSFKMILSILVTLLREKPHRERRK